MSIEVSTYGILSKSAVNAAVAHKRDRRRRPLEFSEFILRLGHSLSKDVDRFVDLVFGDDEGRFETDDALLVERVRRRHPELEALGDDDGVHAQPTARHPSRTAPRR